MRANDEWEPFKRIGQAALIGFVIAALIVLLAGCADKPLTSAQQTEHDERRSRYTEVHQTGPITVIDISVGYCESTSGGKVGTSICDRSIAVESPEHQTYNIGLCRTAQWPPVWHGMHANIFFRLREQPFDGNTGVQQVASGRC